MSITSYAQNFEDVMLWRALKDVSAGFYIDIGAQHPVIDSVSKAFYENGWRGIHVEAVPSNAALLVHDRPDECVLQAAVSDERGLMHFYEVQDTGLSTGDKVTADGYQSQGFTVHQLTVPTLTLADVFDQAGEKDIHWLKIDVECMETRVISGWGDSKARPWIVVVESTLPNSQIESHEQWEPLLLVRGYRVVYSDGLNRFYVSETHDSLAEKFRFPPNIFDHFFLNGTTPYCFRIQSLFDIQEKKHIAEIDLLRLNLKLEYSENRAEETQFQKELQHISLEINQFNSKFMGELEGFFQVNKALLERVKDGQTNLDSQVQVGNEGVLALKQLCTSASMKNNQEFDSLYRDLIASNAAQIGDLIRRHADRESQLVDQLKVAKDELINQQQQHLSDTKWTLVSQNTDFYTHMESAHEQEMDVRYQLNVAQPDCNKLRRSLKEVTILSNKLIVRQDLLLKLLQDAEKDLQQFRDKLATS